MMHHKGMLLAMLLSSTTATFFRQQEEDDTELGPTLGETFLAAANNFTGTTTAIIETSANINAQLDAEAVLQVADEFRSLCNKHGYVEHESTTHGDPSIGGSFYSNINCRMPTSQMDFILDKTRTMVDEAGATTYDSSLSSYVSYSYNPSSLLAQKMGLEELLRKAETIEQVMLIIPSWQNVASQFYPTTNTSTVSINLSQNYENMYPAPSPWTAPSIMTLAPAAAPSPTASNNNNNNNNNNVP
jgi:hypothetical protein